MLRFGTDGVRGLANAELTPEYVMALGRAAGRVLAGGVPSGPEPSGPEPSGPARRRFIVGRDTRLSSSLLQAALSAGLAGEGIDVVDAGIIATPAVAYLSAEQKAPAAVISASHNPFWDNGVKFFSAGGSKLPSETEEALEAELGALFAKPERPWAPTRAAIGQIASDPDALGRYEQHVLGCLEGRRLGGLRVALDCANGAAFQSAPAVFESAGAQLVAVLATEPDGMNINDKCGSTDPRRLAEAVVSEGADLGLAFDGDADRMIAVDAAGNVVDGDRLVALFATDLASRQLLVGDTVVVTVMTNLGFHQAMRAAGVNVHTVSVGDRYVLEALDANKWSLGGSSQATSSSVRRHHRRRCPLGAAVGRLADEAASPPGRAGRGRARALPQVLRNVPSLTGTAWPGPTASGKRCASWKSSSVAEAASCSARAGLNPW